jgi:hypothetical protein
VGKRRKIEGRQVTISGVEKRKRKEKGLKKLAREKKKKERWMEVTMCMEESRYCQIAKDAGRGGSKGWRKKGSNKKRR